MAPSIMNKKGDANPHENKKLVEKAEINYDDPQYIKKCLAVISEECEVVERDDEEPVYERELLCNEKDLKYLAEQLPQLSQELILNVYKSIDYDLDNLIPREFEKADPNLEAEEHEFPTINDLKKITRVDLMSKAIKTHFVARVATERRCEQPKFPTFFSNQLLSPICHHRNLIEFYYKEKNAKDASWRLEKEHEPLLSEAERRALHSKMDASGIAFQGFDLTNPRKLSRTRVFVQPRDEDILAHLRQNNENRPEKASLIAKKKKAKNAKKAEDVKIQENRVLKRKRSNEAVVERPSKKPKA